MAQPNDKGPERIIAPIQVNALTERRSDEESRPNSQEGGNELLDWQLVNNNMRDLGFPRSQNGRFVRDGEHNDGLSVEVTRFGDDVWGVRIFDAQQNAYFVADPNRRIGRVAIRSLVAEFVREWASGNSPHLEKTDFGEDKVVYQPRNNESNNSLAQNE